MSKIDVLKGHATNIRKNIVKMVTEAKSGHPGGSLSSVEIATAIYFTQMNIDENNLTSNQRDRFVLSKGHASPLLYAVLAEKGFLEETELATFRKLNSRLQGHPSMRKLPGVDMSTGSLGQGISTAVGMALSNKYHKLPYRVYTLLGDGECQEGEVWEAAMAAAHYKLDNLLAFVDNNGLQIDGKISDVMNPSPIDEKFKAFGWNVITLEDGNDLASVIEACEEAKTVKGKPTVVVAKTVKGKGVSFMENQAGWHGVAPSAQQCQDALKELEGNK
ncbi:transketolase [Longicatena caecimuris]|uniref:Transketolase subunit A n=1 Tax=Longicatena caecimuris TaxID=1796635 RepID=A0A4V2VKA7_9FIRM|nr:transketolase [Longicatena caecimuris]MCR1870253.1 transketolase [Longicatena caecimuris]MCU0101755.1 transketolase [Longicatena caecimuris]TCU59215.1 transketolase subunit A [Longicatena caecimuris]